MDERAINAAKIRIEKPLLHSVDIIIVNIFLCVRSYSAHELIASHGSIEETKK